MADNKIDLIARLNVEDSAKKINQTDIPKLQKKIEGIKIKCKLDTDSVTSIQSQLANVKINAPQIDLGVGNGSELINNVSHIVDDVENKILELKQNLAKEFGINIEKIITNTVKNARGQISSFSFDITKLSGDVEKFNYTVNRQKDKDSGSVITTVKQISSRDSDRGAIKLLERQEAQVDKLTQKLIKLKAGFDNVNAPRPILNQDNINQLNDEYSKTDEIIKNIGNSTSETFDKMVSDANKAILVYENLGRAMRDAENTATELSSNDIGSAKSLLGGNIDSFIARVSKSSIADSNVIVTKAEEIKKSLDNIGDSHGLKIARDDFNKLRGEFSSLDAQAKSASFAETLKNRVEKLSATMSAFAEKNERAVKSVQTMSSGKTFAQEWQELSNALSKGGLSSDELRHLQERFAIFGKEAEAAGLKGKTAWEKFLGTFKTFSSYITANMVFNVFKRQVSQLVQEVINLDTAMTELRKVTEATEPEFDKFLETAKKSAQYLGSSVTDLVNATSTFSRLGYSLSEAQNLGEIATLYKNVGDGIDISTASESIVSTLKAFKIEANDAIGIIDKLNEVGNNFAISSGGIGEALLRSASAMSAANNDLSQTIALITTANTIAQNPESVGTGLKTMALRLRSTKTEIEEMGEDAEGAAENVSKLREQVLALTKNKVDIQLDENTYKSSYEILLEISKVWNELNDISRASLLEQLFGKRQANVGAAILENGELLQQVYDTAENSIGSATKEQERFSQSIQYSINSFKAAYQSLASDVVDSGFVKEVVDLGSSIIKGLDFIITKTGILQGLLVGFSSLAIFKTIPTLLTQLKSLGTSLTAFGAIMNTLGASGGGGQIMTLEQLSLVSKQLTNSQFELILSTKSLTNAQLTAMMQARGFTQEQINAQLAIRNQMIATNGLALSEQGAAASTLSLSGAFKGLTAAMAANPIGAIVTAITLLGVAIAHLKNKYQEAIVEAKRLEEERQQRLETTVNELKSFENEQDSIDGITKKYTELLNTTSDITSEKETLTSITDELNEKLGNEKTQIDLVNGSLSENIELIRQQQQELDKQWQRENKENIKEAQDFVDTHATDMPVYYKVSGVKLGENYDEAVQEAEFYFNRMKHLIDENNSDLWKYFETVEELTTDQYGYAVTNYGFKLKEGLDKDVIPDVLKSFRDLYEQLEQYSYMDFRWFKGVDDIDILNQSIDDWEKYLDVLKKNTDINHEFWDNTAIGVDETKEQFNSLIDTASELSRKMNETDALPADIYTYTRELNDVRVELEELASSSPELQKRLELVFSTIGLKSQDVSEDVDLLKNKFFDALEEMQKGVFSKTEKINDAIVKILSGDALSSTEAWEVLEMDTTGILNPIINANGDWILQSEELVALKERLIGLSKKEVESDLESARNQVISIDKQLAAQYAIIKEQQEIIAQTHGNSKPNEENLIALQNAKNKVGELLEVQKKYSEEVKLDNLLLQEHNNRLKLSTEQTKKLLEAQQKKLNDEITQLNKEADNLLKAQEYVIDQRIKDHENEKKALENEKKLLEEQLDVLEQQQSELEDMIEDYKSIAGVVEDELGKSIENLKKQQEAEENAVQAKIDALKESREQQDEENSLLEKELELKEKLANLDKAKSTKVRTFSSARGWHFDVDREAVANAEEEVRAAQKSYDDAVADKAYKDQEKALEKEKEAISKNYEAEIKAYEDYIQQYKDVLEEETVAENERLAEQILGANWREKINKTDIELLGKFRSEYGRHNTALKNLTNTEIAMTEASIKAKDAEINAKQLQIDMWNKYKTDVQTAAQDAKNANEDYMKYVNEVLIPDEANSFVTRELNLLDFKEKYTGYMDEIASKQAELDSVADSLTNLQDIANGFDLGDLISNLERMTDQFGNALLTVDEFEKMWEDTYEKQKRMGIINSASAAYVMGSHSEGGVADYTGLAMLHGTKQKSETIFNANDSAKLYDMIHNTPNLMADMVSKAVKISRPTIANNSTTNNPIFNIQRMEINGVQNPKEFTEAFNKNIEAYWKTKLTENRVK